MATTEREQVAAALKLSVQVMAFSSVGAAGALVLFWVPTRLALAQYLTNMDMAALEAAVAPVVDYRGYVATMTPAARQLFIDLSVLVPRIYHPICGMLLYRLAPSRVAAIGIALLALSIAASMYVRFVRILADVASLLPAFLGTGLVSLALPKGNSFLALGLLQAVALVVTLTILLVMSTMPPTVDKNKAMLACTFFPALREIMYGLSRYSARRLMLHWQPGGEGAVRREFVWVFVLWTQIGTSLLVRVFFSGFRSTGYLVLTVVAQSVIEIVSRLSIDWRDNALRRAVDSAKSLCVRRCAASVPSATSTTLHDAESTTAAAAADVFAAGAARRKMLRQSTSTVVIPLAFVPSEAWTAGGGVKPPSRSSTVAPAPATVATHVASEDERVASRQIMATLSRKGTELEATSALHHKIAHTSFTTVVVLGEMLSEYTAILMIPFLLILFEDQRLAMPFDYYAQVAEPFRNVPLDRWDIATSTGIQLVSEVLVDCLCCFVESRRGYHLAGVWRQARWLGPQLVWAAMLASSGVGFFMQNHREVSPCRGFNYCDCDRANLVKDGLRDLYW